MLIRCQQCRATFSLQDGVAPGGASFKVECGRCLHVFETAAPARPSPTPVPLAPAGAGHLPLPDEQRSPRPEVRSPRPEVRSPQPKARSLKPALWLAGALVLALAAFGITRARLAGVSRATQARILKAREKMLRDDAQSLQEAAALFTEAARLSPGEAEPEAERAFALLLLAGTHQSLADRGDLRFLQEGLAAAKVALDDDAGDAAALRAMALHAALTGAPGKGAEPLDRAERRAPGDPWIAYTRAALLLAGPPSRAGRDAALLALAAARQAQPRMLRAQVEVAAISAERGEAGPARLELTRVLQQNPKHERARRLLASLPPGP